jgi:hypothetical protein
MKEFYGIFHAMSWNIPSILFCHMELIYDVEKYSMPCHGIFCQITYVICWGESTMIY